MARRMTAKQARYFGKRTSARRVARFSVHRSRRSFGSGIGSDVALVGGAALYGAGREWLSQKLEPITTKVAGVAGSYADEAVLGALGYFMAKGKIPGINRIPLSREVGRAMLTVEAARVGSGLAAGMMPGQSSSRVDSIYGV